MIPLWLVSYQDYLRFRVWRVYRYGVFTDGNNCTIGFRIESVPCSVREDLGDPVMPTSRSLSFMEFPATFLDS